MARKTIITDCATKGKIALSLSQPLACLTPLKTNPLDEMN